MTPLIPDGYVDEAWGGIIQSLINFSAVAFGGLTLIIIGLAVGLYRSVPPAFQDVIKSLAQGSMVQAEKYLDERLQQAKLTANPYDDELFKSLSEKLKALESRLGEAFSPPTPEKPKTL